MPENRDDFKNVMPIRNLPGMLRSRINEANNGGLTPSTTAGQDGSNLNGYPKEFFERDMLFKDKIQLILNEKEITLSDFANKVEIDQDLLKKLMDKDKLPKYKVLEKIAEFSGYSVEFLKSKPVSKLFK